MAPQASEMCGPLPPDHHRVGSCTSKGIDSGKMSGSFSLLKALGINPWELDTL